MDKLLEIRNYFIIIVLLGVLCERGTGKARGPKSEANKALGIREDYNKHLRPNHKGKTDNVDVGIRIYSIGPISETEMTMSFDCYFRLKWQDPRLISAARFLLEDNQRAVLEKTVRQLSANAKEELRMLTRPPPGESTTATITTTTTTTTTTAAPGSAQKPLDFVTLGEEYAMAMWSPDLFFPDAVDIKRPGKGILSESTVLVLYENGDVFRSMRLQVKSRCKLDLTLFPMDVQNCDVCLESYQYHSLDVNVSWGDKLVMLEKEKVRKYGTANFDILYDTFTWRKESLINFNYPYATLCLTITLQRKLSIYLITIYLPSISLVALSWVGFWIDKRAVPARASLTITTILAQITLITGAANQFPGIADLKLVDLYLIVNFFYVFASLIEFALVSYEPPVKTLSRTWLQNTRMKLANRQNAQSAASSNDSKNSGENVNNNSKEIKGKLNNQDGNPASLANVIGQCEAERKLKKRTTVGNVNLNSPQDAFHQLRKQKDEIGSSVFTNGSQLMCPKSPSSSRVVINPQAKEGRIKTVLSNNSNFLSPPLSPSLTKSSPEKSDVIEMSEPSLNDSNVPFFNSSKSHYKKPRFDWLRKRTKERYTKMRQFFSKENADEVSKLLFPLTFIIWNLIYFGLSFFLVGRLPW